MHVVHDRRKEDHCAGCFKTLENAVECVECGEFCGVKYCADVCRESDVAHVAECSMVRTNAGTGADLRGARMCLRLIHRRTEDPERFAKVMNALRCEKKSPTPAATRLASAVRHRADVNPQEVEDMLGKTRENSHGVVDWKLRQLGTGIYPEASMFNHSCAPNAVVSFAAGGKLNVCCIGVDDYEARAMEIGPKGHAPLRRPRPIGKGEEVCIAYTELYRPAASRRLTLEKSKGFTCECVRCANASVLKALDTELHAAMDGVEEVADEMAKELEEGIDASRAAYAIGDFEGAVESAERVLESSDGVLATTALFTARGQTGRHRGAHRDGFSVRRKVQGAGLAESVRPLCAHAAALDDPPAVLSSGHGGNNETLWIGDAHGVGGAGGWATRSPRTWGPLLHRCRRNLVTKSQPR